MKSLYSLAIVLIFIAPFKLFAQSPTAPAMDFNVFVKNNAILVTNETEGPVAIGGDLVIAGNYQVSTNQKGTFKVGNKPVTLVVGEKVLYQSGNALQVNQNGYVKLVTAQALQFGIQIKIMRIHPFESLRETTIMQVREFTCRQML